MVTVLFCDVEGSTAAADQLDPEEWTEIISGVFEHMIDPVYQYGGTVARLMGDGILAFFGAPIAHEDDPQRAVLAGLEILRRLEPYRARIRAHWDVDCNVRIGIHTGLVVVGEVGSDLRSEYTAMGDAINLAARLEETAQPGTIQVSERTYRLVVPLFALEFLGEMAVKGKERPVRVYRVVGRRPRPEPLLDQPGRLTPLVGRSEEMSQLQQAVLDLLQGHGQIIFLLAEAGLGKTRLIDELRARWHNQGKEGPQWVVGRGASYDASRAYGVFQQFLRQLSNVTEHDPPALVRQRIREQAHQFPPDNRGTMIRISEMLLGVEEAPGLPAMDGRALQQELFAAFLTSAREAAVRKPMVIVFDDLHWADPASVDLLEHLFQLVDEVPLLFLCALRPYQRTPGWRARQMVKVNYGHRYAEIELAPLSAQESDKLVSDLMPASELSSVLRQLILLKAEGNPFFVEEVARTLLEDGIPSRTDGGTSWGIGEISIPDNLQALLTARIDRLDAGARNVLQLASVIGRTFDRQVLAAILDDPQQEDRLEELLDTLVQANLVVEQPPASEPTYSFRHDLTREAAYASILLRRRSRLHARVGQAIETLHPDRVEKEAHRLAQHFREARDFDRALAYYVTAGDVAARLYANAEAVEHYSRALELTGQGVQPGSGQLHHIYAGRGRALELSGRYAEALANYHDMEQAAHAIDDKGVELASLVMRATLHSTPTPVHDLELGRETSERALILAQQMGARAEEARILWNLSLVSGFAGLPREAISYGEQSLAIARQESLREQEAYALNDLAINGYMDTGQLQRAWDAYEQARAIWRELGNRPMTADNLTGASLLHYLFGQLDDAIAKAREARRISEAIGNLWGQSYSRWPEGETLWELGLVDQAMEVMTECMELAEEAGFLAATASARLALARMYGFLGLYDTAHDLVNEAERRSRATLRIFAAWPRVVRARLHLAAGDTAPAQRLLAQVRARDLHQQLFNAFPLIAVELGLAFGEMDLAEGDPQRAVQDLNEFLSYQRRSGMKARQADALLLKGGAHVQLGEEEQAVRSFEEAAETARSLSSRRMLWQVLMALADLTADPSESQRLRDQARDGVAYLRERIGSVEHRRSFLGRPDVRALVSASSRPH